MVKNLSIRWKIFSGFGIVLALLAVITFVSILSVTKIGSNSRFIKDTAFRQALHVIEIENILKELAGHISSSVDTGTGEGLAKARKLKEELDTKWADAETIFAGDESTMKGFHTARDKVEEYFRLGDELVRITMNQEWTQIGTVTQNYNRSREEVFLLITGLKTDGIKKLDRSLFEIVKLSKTTAIITIVVLVIAFLAGVLLTYRIGAGIVNPLRKLTDAASAIAGGELTREVVIESGDEIGKLAASFSHMTTSLKGMLEKIHVTFESLEEISGSLDQISRNISEGSHQTVAAVEKVYRFADEMNRTMQAIAANMEEFSHTTEEMSAWILEMTSSVSELAKNAEILSASVNDTTSSIHEFSASISSVGTNISSLLDRQTSASSSIMEISGSIKEVEGMTRTSATLAETVNKTVAEKGVHSVTRAVNGMLAVSQAVSRSSEIIQQLGNNIENIGRIVGVIDEIADQTKLLSLNAAILAAQAGEHGKGFTVVSDEIGALSENTIRSTKEIAGLINTITSESKSAVQAMTEGSRTASDGVSLVKAVDSVLNEINGAAASSYEIAKQISLSSIEQTRSGNFIIESIQDVTLMCENINKATMEQRSGVNLMVEAAERMKDIASLLKRTTEEQMKGSQRVAENVDVSVARSKSILESIRKSNRDNEQLVKSVGDIQVITKRNLEVVSEMNSTMNILSQQAKLLKEELRKFRF